MGHTGYRPGELAAGTIALGSVTGSGTFFSGISQPSFSVDILAALSFNCKLQCWFEVDKRVAEPKRNGSLRHNRHRQPMGPLTLTSPNNFSGFTKGRAARAVFQTPRHDLINFP